MQGRAGRGCEVLCEAVHLGWYFSIDPMEEKSQTLSRSWEMDFSLFRVSEQNITVTHIAVIFVPLFCIYKSFMNLDTLLEILIVTLTLYICLLVVICFIYQTFQKCIKVVSYVCGFIILSVEFGFI